MLSTKIPILHLTKDLLSKKKQNNLSLHLKPCLEMNIQTTVRLQGIDEDPDKTREQNLVSTYEKITDVMKIVGVEPEIIELRRLGKIQRFKKETEELSRDPSKPNSCQPNFGQKY